MKKFMLVPLLAVLVCASALFFLPTALHQGDVRPATGHRFSLGVEHPLAAVSRFHLGQGVFELTVTGWQELTGNTQNRYRIMVRNGSGKATEVYAFSVAGDVSGSGDGFHRKLVVTTESKANQGYIEIYNYGSNLSRGEVSVAVRPMPPDNN